MYPPREISHEPHTKNCRKFIRVSLVLMFIDFEAIWLKYCLKALKLKKFVERK